MDKKNNPRRAYQTGFAVVRSQFVAVRKNLDFQEAAVMLVQICDIKCSKLGISALNVSLPKYDYSTQV